MDERVVPLPVAQRHKLLFIENTPKDELIKWGRSHLNAGLCHDALEYFDKAGSAEDLENLLHLAVQEVDLVLFLNTLKAMGEEHRAGELSELRENALKLGKESIAAQALSLLQIKGTAK
jgi:hypothetical protein